MAEPTQRADGPAPPARRGWRAALAVYREPAALRMLFLGFGAGLPLPLVIFTLAFWLREAGIDRATIGFLSWVGLAYAFKWVWAPLVDRMPVPLLTRWLGRRRGWLLLAQLGVIAGLAGMSLSDPRQALERLVLLAVFTAFSSATQDIALDGYRIESAAAEQQAALAATYQTGYRLAVIWAGAGVLWVAARAVHGAPGYQFFGWHIAYAVMAASMLVGVVATLLSPEPATGTLQRARDERLRLAQHYATERGWPAPVARAAAWAKDALVNPFADFLRRYGRQALLILALIGLYRISFYVMGVMANPFYVDMGYSKDEIVGIVKTFGVFMSLAGAFVGGVLATRYGVMRLMLAGAVLSPLGNLLFAWLATRGHDPAALALAISMDNFSEGIAGAAFIAYLSSLTNVSYSATQYALFSSLMPLVPKLVAGYSGVFVNAYGYTVFFACSALIGLPALVLVLLAMRAQARARA
ncbi:MAG: AmpG family muropeptide MFS transporter [Betaproteobacteria bacterium]|nr:AmpG family muropeptide MFS transporter [Betaproteobacteria bacterium]